MRTTAAWAFWRRSQYYGFFTVVFLIIIGMLYYTYLYTEATCFDGKQNGDEAGVDCGGACERICTFTVVPPEVQWARSFKIADGQYNAVAYVENRNAEAAAPEMHYTFSLYDDQGLITERKGTTVLPPGSVYPLFEGRILTGNRTPTRTFLDLEPPDVWLPAQYGREQFTVVERTLKNADASPRLDAVLRNNDLREVRQTSVVATIFDRDRNALTASQTVVDNFAPRSDTNIVFTWPLPIATTIRSCEVPTDVVLAIDLSGSMNDDGGTPPQPIASVLSAAERFVSRLGTNDQAAVISFATDAAIRATLSSNIASIRSTIGSLVIPVVEETGSTNTGDALLRATDELTSERHNTDARKVLVVLTDGKPTAPAEDPEGYALAVATAMKGVGIDVYAIGLGENVNIEFINSIASDTSKAYQALANEDIDRIYQEITSSLCEEGAAIIEIIPKTGAIFE